MSQDPRLNPFSPTGYSIDSNPGVKMPLRGYAKIACIFFIILGALGLLQFLMTVARWVITTLMHQEGAIDLNSIFPGAVVVAVLFAVVNGAVSLTEVIGGVWGLKQKRSGANLIRFTAAFMVVFKLVETVYDVIVGLMITGPISKQLAEQMQKQPNQSEEIIGQLMKIGEILMLYALVFGALFGLFMLLFYLFTFLFFCKKTTLAQFS
jgi:hypothetical protein